MLVKKSNFTKYPYIFCSNRKHFSYSSPDVFHSCLSANNIHDKQLSFFGLFTKKIVKDENVKELSQGGYVDVIPGEQIEIPKELISIHFESGKSLDINSSDFSEKINLLKEGEPFKLPINFIDDEQVSVCKKDGHLFLENTSKSKISIFSDSYFKNYDETYLKSKFNRERVPFYLLISDKYNQIRHAHYDEKVTFPCGKNVVFDVSKQEKPNLMVFCNDGWLFRIPKHNVKNIEKDKNGSQRISLNVVANPALIEELDNLFISGKYTDSKNNRKSVKKADLVGINYKVPYRTEAWLRRHDPVTIYKTDAFSSDVVDAIASISQKYKRESVNNVPLVGAFANKPWIALEKDFTEKDFLEIKNIAEMYSSSFADAMCQHAYEKWNYQDGYIRFSASTGMVNACRFLLDEYIEYLKL